MNKSRITYSNMFYWSIFNFKRVFDLFDASLLKAYSYFVLLNLIAFIPITYQLMTIETIDYARFGMDFTENLPEWLPSELPSGCEFIDHELLCLTDDVFEYDVMNNETNYHIMLNVADGTNITSENTIIFYKTGFKMNFTNSNMLRLTYRGFDNVDFADLQNMEQQEAADILIDGMFNSIKPTLVLPLIIFFVGSFIVMNFILIATIAALSMMFSFNQNDFPCYKNMLKLMIFASTIPSVANLVLGFYGLSAFTAIAYNIATPIIAYFMYKHSRVFREIN